MPVGRSNGGNARPVFAVDLVSNSDRMLLAHRRNHHQATTLTQRLDTLDRKCQRSLDRMREDIRHIYFREQLPREFEVLELEARQRRAARDVTQHDVTQHDVTQHDVTQHDVTDCHTPVTQHDVPVIQTHHSPRTSRTPAPRPPPSYSADLSLDNHQPHHNIDSFPVPVPVQQEVAARSDGPGSVYSVEDSIYSRDPSMTTPWRRPSMLSQRRESSAPLNASGRHRRTSEERGLGEQEQEQLPQKSPEEVMAAVRAVYDKTPMSKRNPRPRFWQKLIPPHLASARLEAPPRPPPSQIRSQVKERLDAFLTQLQDKYRQEEAACSLPPAAHHMQPVDFTHPRWKPYKILLEQTRAIYYKPRHMTLPDRARTYTSMTSHTCVIPEAETTERFYRNRIINGDDESEASMSFVISKSRPQSTLFSD